MTASSTTQSSTLSTSPISASAPVFGAVLGRTVGPKRRLGTGAAFAVAAHLWILVAALAAGSQKGAGDHQERTEVVFMSSPPPPPPPPPPPGGAPEPKNTPRVEKPKVDPDIYKETKNTEKPRPEEEPAPEDEPTDQAGAPGGQEGGVAGGVVGGVVGGVLGGQIGGVIGGTGTGKPPPATPPPTFLQINIGEGTDQSAPVWVTSPKPPYPPEARAAKATGLVIARCNAYPDGSLQGCKILKSHPFFDSAVLAHLAKTRVKPFTNGGKPVSGFVPLNIPIKFDLK